MNLHLLYKTKIVTRETETHLTVKNAEYVCNILFLKHTYIISFQNLFRQNLLFFFLENIIFTNRYIAAVTKLCFIFH